MNVCRGHGALRQGSKIGKPPNVRQFSLPIKMFGQRHDIERFPLIENGPHCGVNHPMGIVEKLVARKGNPVNTLRLNQQAAQNGLLVLNAAGNSKLVHTSPLARQDSQSNITAVPSPSRSRSITRSPITTESSFMV